MNYMKMIKAVFFVFVGLTIMITLISLLIPSRIVTASAVSVQADSTKLFSEVSELKNWRHWHPAFKNDSSILNFTSSKNELNDIATWEQNGKAYQMVVTEKKYPLVKINIQAK